MSRVQPLLLMVLVAALSPATALGGTVIENFDGAPPTLVSYPDQDSEPDDWQLTASNPHGGTGNSLRLDGNTWKQQTIAPTALSDSTVWEVAVYCSSRGDMQGFGFGDGVNEIFYTFYGRDLPESTTWYTVYQGARDQGQWQVFKLPVGRDWLVRHGSLPVIDRLVYVNDCDTYGGAVLFDSIADVTDDQPRPPLARILYTVDEQTRVADKLYRLGVQFQGEVSDPDSDPDQNLHTWFWDFGDSTTSTLRNPVHQFLVHADHPWTVGLRVTDPDGMCGGDTCQIAVAPGEPGTPLTVNFVGDVFTGRGYEYSGGIIATQGVEALFAPTLGIFGQAADVNVANLEVSYTDRGTPHPTKSVVFRSRPENIAGIQYAGVDLVTLGNNHIIDYGEIGMLDTMAGLDALGIPYCGAGSTEYLALLPAFHTEKGVRLGFLGLCNRTGRQWNYQPFLDAGYDKPGFAHLLPVNLASSIAYTRPLADLVIVQTHSGDEYLTSPDKGGVRPLIEAAVDEAPGLPDQPAFKFRNEPTPGERELRRLAIDHGADVLINHHPHVLQGFESYDGKLIAHSLGNFVFDLYYTETMPTLVLTLEIEKTGITDYRFTPAWINHWIPEPATGTLGHEIIGRLAEYSRPMGALVTPISDSDEARIHLSRAAVDSSTSDHPATLTLVAGDGHVTSPPLRLADLEGWTDLANLCAVETAGTDWEVRWGKELLWLGGFEDEGADLWEVNTEDEVLVEDVAHSGRRSLRLRRLSSAFNQTGTDLEKHLPLDGSKEHSAVGWLRAENARQTRIMVRFYSDRYSSYPLGDHDLDTRLDGDSGWNRQWSDLPAYPSAAYFDMRCGHEPPAEGTAYSWYDDLALIEWEEWTPATGPVPVPAPNNYRFVQVRRAGSDATPVNLLCRAVSYGPSTVSSAPEQPPLATAPGLRCYPNPFNPRVTIEVELGAGSSPPAGPALVAIHDLRGRKVRTLHRGSLPPGLRFGLTWDGTDDAGHELASGVYLVRLQVGKMARVQKIALVR